ncbi:hypothetical protein ANN_08601 [Periplaneta americana]|uniref:Reverse transcriptase domain-containing protein n=1 Tax=Periplaneta americana TaxID=6978 RepID=A0ABQ8T443_PERAM|nr:hypothetical protein ANN_08601 [Periplaneta americana]
MNGRNVSSSCKRRTQYKGRTLAVITGYSSKEMKNFKEDRSINANLKQTEWSLKPHGSIPTSRLSQIDTLLFADDIVFMATSEDNLQRLVYNFNQMAKSFNMKISTDKSELMAFLGNEPVRSKICINNKIIEQIKNFSYLGYQISYEEEKDLNEKIIKFNRAMGIINQMFKPTLVQKHTRTRIYKTLARPILCFGSEAWTIRNIDSQRFYGGRNEIHASYSGIYENGSH